MRISDQMVTNLVVQANRDAKEAIFLASKRIASGKSVESPSDDPVKAQKSVQLSSLLARLDDLEVGRESVAFDLDVAESVLLQGMDVLGKMKALSVQMANASASPEDQAVAAETAAGAFQELLDLANTQLDDGQFLFGGTASDAEPYAADGSYVGSDLNRAVEIAPGAVVEGAVTGAQGFGTGGEVFQVMADFQAALEAGDLAGIQAAVESFDGALEFMATRIAEMGARISVLEDTGSLSDELRLRFLVEKGVLEDIDLTEEITRFQAAENALQAVVQVSGRLLSRSLTSFLGAF